MKCFVTGASGFVGANLVHELNARGHSVKALLRPNTEDAVEWFHQHGCVKM